MIRVLAYAPAEGEHGVPISVRIHFVHDFLPLAYVRLLVGSHPVPTQVKELEPDLDSSFGKWQLDASAPPFYLTGAMPPSYTVQVSVQALDEQNTILDSVVCGEFTYWLPEYSRNNLNANAIPDLPSSTAHLARKRAYTLPSTHRPPPSAPNTISPSIAAINTNRSFIQRRARAQSGAGRSLRQSPDTPESVHTPVLDLITPLDSMVKNWTPDEIAASRRLVLFNKVLEGHRLIVSFDSVSQDDYDVLATTTTASPAVISCIYRADTDTYHATSVDIIYLLERLVEEEFPVEEKNRIRRNLEGLRPTTVSKHKPGLDGFFSTIMEFPDPKPRNIEKDLKVFDWHHLGQALEKILSKYSVYALPATASNVSASPLSYIPPVHTPVLSHSTPSLSANDLCLPYSTKREACDITLAPLTFYNKDDDYSTCNGYVSGHPHDPADSSDSASVSGSSGPHSAHWTVDNGHFAAQHQQQQRDYMLADAPIRSSDAYQFEVYEPIDYRFGSKNTPNGILFSSSGGNTSSDVINRRINSSVASHHSSGGNSPLAIMSELSVPSARAFA